MAEPTIEKDIDTTQITDRNVNRSSNTGSDDKSKAFDVKHDVGGPESIEAQLANVTGLTAAQANRQFETAVRQQEEQHQARLRQQEELNVIKQRQLTNGADYDQDMRELRISNLKASNEQRTRLTEIAADRQWNIDEQVYAARQLGIDPMVAFKMIAEASTASAGK